MKTKIVIADDHPIVLMGVRHALEGLLGLEICGEAENSTDLIALMDKVKPDLLVSDFYMPGGDSFDGIALIAHVKRRFPRVKIVILTMLTNPLILRAVLESGVDGVLLKNGGQLEIATAVQSVLNHQIYTSPTIQRLLDDAKAQHPMLGENPGWNTLSPREMEVLRLFVSGLTVSEIAKMLRRSVKTISHHKIAAQRKLGISNDRELYEYALHNGLS
ncbi:response regulator transcription factor [Andreprevotia chitinilytica]|uniref:response regulator transcription factor n=1 Tax=Andreprevotia chitinilytica TaxID=396808 RepID=UPI000557BB97|nr:response regulator transcription factor [Andreprevotia chitinilytica]